MTQFFITSPIADIYGTPDTKATRGKFETQLVYGETFIVDSVKDGWAKGRCDHDGYEGYIEEKHLATTLPETTHIVTAVRSFAYQDATMKSPCLNTLSFGSRVSVVSDDGNFSKLSDGSFVYSKHLTPVADVTVDPVPLAKRFLETPYYWGGRSGMGIDCSGLIQVIFARASVKLPRDTEDQVKLGTPVDKAARGDVVFFPGHVGIMSDDKNIIHANAFNMKVTEEPLTDVAERSKGIIAIRRFTPGQ